MTCEKQDEKEAGDGDDQLFSDGGGPVSVEATGDGVHGREIKRIATAPGEE